MSKDLLIGVIVIFIATISLLFMSSKRKPIKGNLKQTNIYLLIFALSSLIINLGFIYAMIHYYQYISLIYILGHQILFIGLGILHIFLAYKFLPWFLEELHIEQLFFSLIISLMAIGFQFMFFYRIFDGENFVYPIIPSFIAFMAPSIIMKSYVYLMNIPEPQKKYLSWIYPKNDDIEEPDGTDLSGTIILNIYILKSTEDSEPSNYTVKAPVNMNFGVYIYFLIKNFNENNQEDPIRFYNEKGDFYSWYFSVKPKWFQSKRFIDPSLTIKENNLKDNITITCDRIK